MVTQENRRRFTVDGLGDFFIATPSADDIRSSDWHYSKVYSQSLVEGLTTSAEMQDILRRRGIIGDAYDKKVTGLKEDIGKKIVEMELSAEKDIRKSLALEISSLREELFKWNQRVNGPLSHTAEQVSDDSRLEFLTSCIVQRESGARVWSDFDAYKLEENKALTWQSRFEVMLFLQGLEPNFLENTPENVVLRELDSPIDSTVAVTEPVPSVPSPTEAVSDKPKRGRKAKK